MVVRWKWDEDNHTKHVLMSTKTKLKMMVYLKRVGDWGRENNEYVMGQLIHEAWAAFKEKYDLDRDDNWKRELTPVEFMKQDDKEISEWATKWGLLQLVLTEYLEDKLAKMTPIVDVVNEEQRVAIQIENRKSVKDSN